MANKPNGGKGRPQGTKNKYTATAKENIACVFTRLGGTHGMFLWAAKNKDEFYKLYARLIPVEQHISGPNGDPIEANISSTVTDPAEAARIYQSIIAGTDVPDTMQ